MNDGSANELRPITFDPLEVLDYLENGFTHSHLDRWFTGSMPSIAASELIAEPFESVGAVLATARSFLEKKSTRATSDDVHMSEGDISVVGVDSHFISWHVMIHVTFCSQRRTWMTQKRNAKIHLQI